MKTVISILLLSFAFAGLSANALIIRAAHNSIGCRTVVNDRTVMLSITIDNKEVAGRIYQGVPSPEVQANALREYCEGIVDRAREAYYGREKSVTSYVLIDTLGSIEKSDTQGPFLLNEPAVTCEK